MRKLLRALIGSTAFLLCFLASVGWAQGKSKGEYGVPFQSINNRYYELQLKLKSVEATVSEIFNKLDSIESGLLTLDKRINLLEDQNNFLLGLINSNNFSIAAIQDVVQSLVDENNSLKNAIDSNTENIAAAIQKIQTNHDLISYLDSVDQATVTDLKNYIERNDQVIALLALKVEELQSSAEVIAQIKTGSCPSGSAQIDGVASLSSTVTCLVSSQLVPPIYDLKTYHTVGVLSGSASGVQLKCPYYWQEGAFLANIILGVHVVPPANGSILKSSPSMNGNTPIWNVSFGYSSYPTNSPFSLTMNCLYVRATSEIKLN